MVALELQHVVVACEKSQEEEKQRLGRQLSVLVAIDIHYWFYVSFNSMVSFSCWNLGDIFLIINVLHEVLKMRNLMHFL